MVAILLSLLSVAVAAQPIDAVEPLAAAGRGSIEATHPAHGQVNRAVSKWTRESIKVIIPGIFVGRLELRPLADPLSAEEKEALRNDVIALAKAEGFLGTEPPGSERGTGRRGAKRPFAARVVNKLGPHHVAYGYLVDSDGKQWTLEIAVNNEKEGVKFHLAARGWLGSFEGKVSNTTFSTRGDKSSILR